MFQKSSSPIAEKIALRIIRACRELGVSTAVVYSSADRDAAYLNLADQAICIGEAPPAEELSEYPAHHLAARSPMCRQFIPATVSLRRMPTLRRSAEAARSSSSGLPVSAMAAVGDKVECKRLARKAKVPTVPGSDGQVEDEKQALAVAEEIGYRDHQGRGGWWRTWDAHRHNEVSLRAGIKAAKSEAENAFKDSTVYIEKYIERGRHVEVQILGDHAGNCIHLFERDCTLQRRHQKLVEESPSPVLKSSVREALCSSAVRLAKAAGYASAGTVEFLVDKQQNFYLLEVNARIQVEHPVTECVTGIDLIKGATSHRRRRAAAVQTEGHPGQRARDRVPHQRGGPGPELRPWPGRIEELRMPAGPECGLTRTRMQGIASRRTMTA